MSTNYCYRCGQMKEETYECELCELVVCRECIAEDAYHWDDFLDSKWCHYEQPIAAYRRAWEELPKPICKLCANAAAKDIAEVGDHLMICDIQMNGYMGAFIGLLKAKRKNQCEAEVF